MHLGSKKPDAGGRAATSTFPAASGYGGGKQASLSACPSAGTQKSQPRKGTSTAALSVMCCWQQQIEQVLKSFLQKVILCRFCLRHSGMGQQKGLLYKQSPSRCKSWVTVHSSAAHSASSHNCPYSQNALFWPVLGFLLL